jgi:peptidoglycan hydrolase CwlO-like protein
LSEGERKNSTLEEISANLKAREAQLSETQEQRRHLQLELKKSKEAVTRLCNQITVFEQETRVRQETEQIELTLYELLESNARLREKANTFPTELDPVIAARIHHRTNRQRPELTAEQVNEEVVMYW